MDPIFSKINGYAVAKHSMLTLTPTLRFKHHRIRYRRHNCARVGKVSTRLFTTDINPVDEIDDGEIIVEFDYCAHICNDKCKISGSNQSREHNELQRKGLVKGGYTAPPIPDDYDVVDCMMWVESIEVLYNAGYLPWAYIEDNKIKMNFVHENDELWLCEKKGSATNSSQ